MMDNPQEVNAIFLDPLDPSSRSFIIFAVNDNVSTAAGGSHWSLCVFSRAENRFYHFDSSSKANASACFSLVKILKQCLDCESAEIINVACLQQNNSYDCGIFVLCNTDLVCRTIAKGKTLSSIEKIKPKDVQIKRNEITQIIKSLGGKV